ncbi:uncharacterized protein LOC134201702 [Bombyx mori]|uniref:uncharacterized protein LOC134201702 n=1 Tax=Bombyx mori TaxID=7091 RepID=UPI002ED13181
MGIKENLRESTRLVQSVHRPRISELRRYGEGIEDHGNYILHYKGETPGLYGVGFLIKKRLSDKIEEIKGISERITVMNIVLSDKISDKWTIIQAYSPTESEKKDDIAKIEKFYGDLQTTIDNSYRNIIVMGDFNGKLLHERKILLQGTQDKDSRAKIAEISKRINEKIRKDKKTKRQNTLKKHIQRTGGIKKAIKELKIKKDWMPRVITKSGHVTNFNKAFDSLEHEYIWRALHSQGIEEKYISILKKVYSRSTAQMRFERTGEEFPIERGVRQGDPISPKLFSAVLEMIFRDLEWNANNGLNINGENLNHLRFADDLILFSECPKRLEEMLQQLSDQNAKAGLSINPTKTKLMTNSSKAYNVKLNSKHIEYVDEYVYLGQLISTTDNMQKEIDRRIANTWKRYWSLSEVMKDKEMSIKDKRKIFNSCILPCLTYGCQTWALTEKLTNKIQVCQNSIERSVIGVKRRDKVRLSEIKRLTKFKNAIQISRTLKWRWTGHILREKYEKWTKIITEWYPRDGCRKKRKTAKTLGR